MLNTPEAYFEAGSQTATARLQRTKHGPASIVTGSAVLAGWRRLKIEQRHSATSMKAMPPSSRYGAPCICAIEQRSRRCLTQD